MSLKRSHAVNPRGRIANLASWVTGPRVRIPPSPPISTLLGFTLLPGWSPKIAIWIQSRKPSPGQPVVVALQVSSMAAILRVKQLVLVA